MLSDELIRYIQEHETMIDNSDWSAVLYTAYIELSNEDAEILYNMLTNTLEVDLDSTREAVLVQRVVTMLAFAPNKQLEARTVLLRMRNYIGMDEDEFFDFLRNHDDEWFCEYQDGDDGGYMLIMR